MCNEIEFKDDSESVKKRLKTKLEKSEKLLRVRYIVYRCSECQNSYVSILGLRGHVAAILALRLEQIQILPVC